MGEKKMGDHEKMGNKRAWGFIIYPQDIEKENKNWLDYLINTHLPMVVSPIHDCDKWSEIDVERKKSYCKENKIKVGSLKKPHYHIMLIYNNATTETNILNILHNECNLESIKHLEPISSVRGSYDYMSHKFNDDKYPYNEKDIKCYNGFNINQYYEISNMESLKIKKWIITYINDQNIYSYDYLINSLMLGDFDDELNIAMNNTLFFTNYIKSKLSHIDNRQFDTESNIVKNNGDKK